MARQLIRNLKSTSIATLAILMILVANQRLHAQEQSDPTTIDDLSLESAPASPTETSSPADEAADEPADGAAADPADDSDDSQDSSQPLQSLSEISFADPFGPRISDDSPAAWPELAGNPYAGMMGLKFVSERPTGLYHDCLFFEEPLLERHGYGPRPLVGDFRSAKRFLSTAIVLPFTRSGRRALRGQHFGQ